MAEIVCIGDNVVDCYDELDQMFPGGNNPNVAKFVADAGVSSAYIGAVAADAAGKLIHKSLTDANVDLSRLRIEAGRTAHCVIALRDGDRSFVSADIGVSIIKPNDGDFLMIDQAAIVHTSRSSHLDRFLGRFARKALLSYDFGVGKDRDQIAEIAPYCFLATFSGGGLSLDDSRALAQDALAGGAKWVLITRGQEGAMLFSHHEAFSQPATPTVLQDTLGAGDSFIASVLAGMLKKEAPQAFLQKAADKASTTCTHFGAFGNAVQMEVERESGRSLEGFYADARAAAARHLEDVL